MRTNFLVTVLLGGGGKGILFPVNIFFNLLHCYASLIQFELLISIYRNSWFYLVICIICELSGCCAMK